MDLESTLVGNRQNQSRNRLEELKERLTEIALCYYKGFADNLKGIVNNASFYLRHPELDRVKKMQHAYEWFRAIEGFYETIPFNKLQSKNEFEPLLKVRELLPTFRHSLEITFQTENYDEFRVLDDIRNQIMDKAEIYFDSLMQVLKEIKSLKPANIEAIVPKNVRGYLDLL